MADNSDYSKPRLNLIKFLEGTTFDTPVNRSLVENTYNRFLTKDETVESIGTIGLPDKDAALDRQLKEDTVHRQTYQLQPLVHHKVATIDHTSSFKDILSELERLGVDISRLAKWGDTEQFNFAPPVDLDKLINFRDYYWFDPNGLILSPQYIVIKNPCTVATTRLSQRQKDIASVSRMALTGVDLNNNEFLVGADVSTLFPSNTVFDLIGSDPINGLYTVASTRVVNGVTHIKPTVTISSNLYNGAELTFDTQIAQLTTARNKACDGGAGWDVGQWDDAEPLETGVMSIVDPVQLQYIKDTASDMFTLIVRAHPEYVDSAGNVIVSDARPLWQWMDNDQPEFLISWDAFGTRTLRNPWQIDNKWVHKLDLAAGAISQSIRAEAPIIEYLPNLQMNQWSEVGHQWMYRADPVRGEFQPTTTLPTMADYHASDFLDKWIYVGTTTTIPTSMQVENSAAVLMSTNEAASSVLLPYRSFTIDSVNIYTNEITFLGTPTLVNGTSVTISTAASLLSRTTTAPVSVSAGVTTVTLNSVVGVAVGQLLLTPTTNVFDTILFPAAKRQTALAGTNAPRVYVDEVQLLGTFDEITVTGPSGAYYVVGVKLETAASTEQRVDIGVDPAAASDVGKNIWFVRTPDHLNDKQYLEDGRPTTVISPVSFYRMTQSKNIGEQKIPLFDLFFPDGTTANKANQIFFYQLDQAAAINTTVKLRLKSEVRTGVVYFFEQMLIDYDNGPMLCYKDLDSISASNTTGLQTIWRTDLNNPYVPRFVDINRRADGDKYYDSTGVEYTAHVDTTNGDWEIINQHVFNASHENKKYIDTVNLTEHIKTILLGQEQLAGFVPSKYGFRLLDQLNYGLSGTIKEHNGSYDTLVSAMFVSGSNPPAVIAYASTAYESALSGMKDYIVTNAQSFLTNKSHSYLGNLSTTVTNDAIAAHENNDNNNVIFGDSNTYINGLGVKNWPATLPFLGLGSTHRPYAIHDAALGVREILHHDGHYDSYLIPQADQIGIARRIARTSYHTTTPVTETRLYGWTTTQPADGGALVSSYLDITSNRVRAGDIWIDGQVFKRFQVIQIGPDAPGYDIPDGALWLRTTNTQLMVKGTTAGQGHWSPLPGSPAGSIAAAWVDVDLSSLLNAVVLEVEQRLYAAAVESAIAITVPSTLYVRDAEDKIVYESLKQDNFNKFARDRQINAPYASVYKQSNPFTWNYSGVNANEIAANNYINVWNPYASPTHIPWVGYWAGVYQNVYGTSYPHREPWILQGFASKPSWWDEWYVDTTGARVWVAAMWTNVLSNRIPAQFDAPGPVLYTEVDEATGIDYKIMAKKFSYVPVNITRPITSSTNAVIYALDALFPLYDSRMFLLENNDIVSGSSTGKPMIRRPSVTANANLRQPFVYGDGSPIEWEWLKSTDRKYGELEIAFLMQPIRFVNAAWGTKFLNVGGLNINQDTHKVFSHWDTIFHGDVVDSKVYESIGINQWYVNYNRSSGLDFKVSNFREMWTEWTMQLAYQFGCYINTRSLDVSSSSYDLIREDFSIISKKSPGFASRRVDSLQVTVANYGDYRTTGALKVPMGDGYTWTFLVDVPSTATEVEFYGVAKYEYHVVDTETGLLEITSGILPWKDGDQVYLYTTQYAPYPLDTAWAYYISTVDGSSTQFRISRNKGDAMNKNGTFLRTEGTGVQYIGQVNATFNALGGQQTPTAWTHNAIDRNQLHVVTVPYVVQGVQGLIDFVDGYAARLEDLGIKANDSSAREIDPQTGRLVSWQTEIERAIGKIYTGIGKSNTSIKQYGNTYKYTVRNVDDDPDVFVLDNVTALPFQLAEEVYMFTEGTVPAGLTLNKAYYIIPVNATAFSLASTPENAYDNIGMNITSSGIGEQYVGVFPSTFIAGDEYVEINPFRNNVWISTPSGIIANVFTGGESDATEEVTIYDQYSRPLPKGSLTVLREDAVTRVVVRSGITNDVIVNPTNSGYDNIHIGGVKFYIDGYEHIVLFNNYTIDGYLIYDPYVGMDVSRLSVSFSRSTNKTLRPSIGGYYYHNGEMIRNLEASVSDMRSYYDTYGGTNNSDFNEYSRALLGYENPTYLDQVNTSDRAKFLFWKGMIQRKGAKNTITSFVNSKHFVDAHVDEFWAHKLSDFGDARQKYKPEINVRVADSYTSDFRYEFAPIGSTVSPRFVGIDYTDDSRWVNPMETQAEMGGNPLYFDAEEIVVPTAVITHSTGKYFTLNSRLDAVRVEYTINASTTVLAVGTGLAKINDRTYKFTDAIPVATVQVFGSVPSVAKLDPVLMIDKQSNVTVASSKVWDPLNGYHYYAPLKNVTYWSDNDPAVYDGVDASWTTEQVGKKWVDSSTFAYVPYDDSFVFPEFNDQMARWGRLAQWADPAVYEWVRTTKTPQQFIEAVAAEEGDTNIPVSQRASGTPFTIIRRKSDNVEITLTPVTAVYDVADKLTTMQANPMYADLDLLVYVNGVFVVQRVLATATMSDFTYSLGDYVTLKPSLPVGETGFSTDYRYATVTEADSSGDDTTVYYFWARSRNVSPRDELSAAQVSSQLAYPNAPYHTYRKFVEASGGMPDRYVQVILRNMAQLVNDDNRYIAQFTRDFTLRDNLSSGRTAMDLKNKHTEWLIFREKQPYKISSTLWNTMAEALIGYEIEGFDNGVLTPVPSMTYTLYDQKNGTTTRYGMAKGQAFVDRDLGLETIQTILEDPTFDTAPIDKYVFLETHTFDTPVNIRQSLQYIFTNFSDASVNRLFFEVMRDALSNKLDFSGLFMTSFVALHGIKILETSGSVV